MGACIEYKAGAEQIDIDVLVGIDCLDGVVI